MAGMIYLEGRNPKSLDFEFPTTGVVESMRNIDDIVVETFCAGSHSECFQGTNFVPIFLKQILR
jgi:hypothetical protein